MITPKTARTVSLLCIGFFAFQGTAFARFSDVSSGHANFDAIAYVQAEGIVSGYPDGTFRPDEQINRAEFAKILEESIPDAPNGIGICPPEPSDYVQWSKFSDIRADDWFWIYVCMQEGRGIVAGYPDGTFRPASNINFAEAAKMFYGANHLDNRGILVDKPPMTEPWFRVYVEYLASQNAIPTSITSFDQFITRGEMAEMIFRLKTNNADKPSVSYEDLASKDAQTTITLYFYSEQDVATASYQATIPVQRKISQTSKVADTAMHSLFEGPTNAEYAKGARTMNILSSLGANYIGVNIHETYPNPYYFPDSGLEKTWKKVRL